MRARKHGEQLTLDEVRGATRNPHLVSLLAKNVASIEALLAEAPPTTGYMFSDLVADPANRLPESDLTQSALTALGIAMADQDSAADSRIPSAMTYFGQFIDHDITLTSEAPIIGKIVPLAPQDVVKKFANLRTFRLDLDSVYQGLAQTQIGPDGKMKLGLVSESGFLPIDTADRLHDLPRRPPIPNPTTDTERDLDREALIGDPRNDENLVVAQLHVAFLRAHNALVDGGLAFDDAVVELRRRYQWSVLHDFMGKVCDRHVLDDVVSNGPTFWKPDSRGAMFMPLEFAAAAYRFGHSMVRASYSHNTTFNPQAGPARDASLDRMFMFTALSGNLHPSPGPGGFPTLPDNWIIDWSRFFDPAVNAARPIDTQLAPPLSSLRDSEAKPFENVMARLAARNLLRGYLLSLPTGQAVAKRLAVPPLDREVLRAAVRADQLQLVDQAGLLDRTPLWFYVLAEAGNPTGPAGQSLGPVGSRIVAETLFNAIRFSENSVITTPPSELQIQGGEFSLRGIVRLGLDTKLPPI